MGAGRARQAYAGDFGHGLGSRDVHGAAFDQFAIAQAQIGFQRAAAVQLQPRLADEQGRDPVERGERPFAAHSARAAFQQLCGLLEGKVPATDMQIGIHLAPCTGLWRQAGLQAQVLGHIELQCQHAAIGGAIAQMERHLPQRVVAGLQLAIDQVERQLQAPGHGRAGDLRRCGIGVHAQALAAGLHLELGMQQLQLGQAGRLVPIMARIAEARGEIHVAQQLHAVIAGVCLAERDFGIEQFGWAATQLLQEPHSTLALADDQQLAEACAADAVAVDGVETQGPALVAARR